jgi:IS30 family transposase
VAKRLLKPNQNRAHHPFDNGMVVSGHENLLSTRGAEVYFANTYRSSEQGLNENSNGLLGQFFPKGVALTRGHARSSAIYCISIQSSPPKSA